MTNSSEHAHGASPERNYLAVCVGILLAGLGFTRLVLGTFGEEIFSMLEGEAINLPFQLTSSLSRDGGVLLGLGVLILLAGQIEVHLRRLWR